MGVALAPADALGDTSGPLPSLSVLLTHPALSLSAHQWPGEAFELQQACGINWNWADILRFFRFVARDGNHLFWTGARSRGKGNKQWYGLFWCKGKTIRAHKFAAVAILGLRPGRGYEIDHSCRQTRCVSCLRLLTREQNQALIVRPKPAPRLILVGAGGTHVSGNGEDATWH